MKRILHLSLILLCTTNLFFSQSFTVSKIEPSNWWKGMKTNQIQLMVYGKNLENVKVESSNLSIQSVEHVENPSYLFVNLDLSESEAGNYQLTFSNSEKEITVPFPVLGRDTSVLRHQGFSNRDAIYLLMPDRFSNGDPSNDFIDGYIDTFQNQYTQARHGGDIQGIIDRLDYIKDLGITTIWITPFVENNTFRSYHGYAATDFYKIDPRLGDLQLYKDLVNKAHHKGLKVILDHVSNHISLDHPWIQNLPTPDWINGTIDDHLNANHNKMVYTDPYADSTTIEQVYRGWFVPYMPDLNQENEYLGNYIKQNTIWWLETIGLDGIREDTYPYCNQKFMSEWAETILEEYPTINILGEVWTGEPAFLSAYQSKNILIPTETNLPTVTDFGMRDVLVDFLTGKSGLGPFHDLLAKDFLYWNSNELVTFIDNHDVGRAMFQANSNLEKFKIAFHLLLTTRGIPQIFYGTEIGMVENNDHGTLRKNFPGGFPEDERNAFTREGRSEYENEIFDFLKQMLLLRQKHISLSTGKMTHFPANNNVYIYFKSNRNELILNVINSNKIDVEINTKEFSHFLESKKILKDLVEHKTIDIQDHQLIKIEGMKAKMFLVQ